MRLRVILCALVCFINVGCYNGTQQEARDLASQISATMAATQAPGTGDAPPKELIAFGGRTDQMPAGCYLRANINGRRWEATAMTPDLDRSSIVEINGRNSTGLINFTIGVVNIRTGKPRKFNEQHGLFFWDENNETWVAKSGECVITNFDQQYIEGKFTFTITDKGKTIVGTEGEFRVPTPARVFAN